MFCYALNLSFPLPRNQNLKKKKKKYIYIYVYITPIILHNNFRPFSIINMYTLPTTFCQQQTDKKSITTISFSIEYLYQIISYFFCVSTDTVYLECINAFGFSQYIYIHTYMTMIMCQCHRYQFFFVSLTCSSSENSFSPFSPFFPSFPFFPFFPLCFFGFCSFSVLPGLDLTVANSL